MKILFDANVYLDWLLAREPGFENSTASLKQAIKAGHTCFISGGSIGDIYYVLRKAFKDKNEAKAKLASLLSLFQVAPITQDAMDLALQYSGKDFEDDIVVAVGVISKVDCIVTNNQSDFQQCKEIKIYSPTEFLALLQQ